MKKSDLANFFHNSNELLCVADAEGYFLELTPAWSALTGYTDEELKAKPFLDFVHPDDKEKTLIQASRLNILGMDAVKFQNRYVCKDKSLVTLNWSSRVVDGLIYAVATDVTEIQQQNFFFEQMQEAATIGYWRLDLQTMTPHWSDKTYDIHGIPRGSKVDLENAVNFYKPAYRSIVERAVKKAFETGEGWDLEAELQNAKGEEVWVRTIGIPVFLEGKVVALHGIFQDITDRKVIDQMLEQSLSETLRYKKALDSQAIVVVTDPQGQITYINERFCEVSGFSQYELLGETHKVVSSGHHPREFWLDLWQTLKSGQNWKGLIKNKKKSGEIYWVDTTITPITEKSGEAKEFMAIQFDVTERVILEEKVRRQQIELIRSSRLASLGEMAGGIAHEINNPLAIITAALAVLKRPLESDTVPTSVILPTLKTISKTVERISKIVEGLRSFSRERDEKETRLIRLADIVRDTLTFCSEKFKSKGVDIQLDLSENLLVEVNPQQIEQIVLNLLNNAFYAVSSEAEKWVKVSTLSQGSIAKLAVVDSGPGVPKDIADRIFQPFFTTKPVGSGTGLGLGISYGIAQRHGGKLYLDTTAERTTFVLELKLAAEDTASATDLNQAV